MEKKTPRITADIIIELEDRRIVLIKRKNPPVGWALPGGFLDYGESLEDCAIREAKEETSLDVELKGQFHTYSTLDRDPRWHTVTMVFVATSSGTPKASTDASEIGVFKRGKIPKDLVFDHNKILEDYFKYKNKGEQGGARVSRGEQGYKKLIVWQNAYKLRRLIYQITARFSRSEMRRVSQMRDGARSVKQNIQEGYKRASLGEYIHFLTIAQGSLSELSGDIDDCYDDGLISKKEFETLDELAGKTDYLFMRQIQSLRKKRNTRVSKGKQR